MDLIGLVDAATLERLAQSETGVDVARRLRIAALEPGDVGVITATVVQIAPARTFNRKNGTSGIIGRVTFTDGTGEVDAVLWDEANRMVRDGTFTPGGRVTIRGVEVKAGYRSGVEIGLENAVIEAAPTATGSLSGTVEAMGDTQVVDGRFKGDIRITTATGLVTVVLWDEVLKQVRDRGLGAEVHLAGVQEHPLLDGWILGDNATLV